MHRMRFIVSVVLVMTVGLILRSVSPLAADEAIRKTAVAGAFYPSNPTRLRNMIKTYLAEVPQQAVDGEIKVLVCPHAGYIYSGQVAAYSYQLIKGKQYDAVVVLALSHYYPFRGASVFDGDFYETPLGNVPIDHTIVTEMKDAHPLIDFHPPAHKREHSLEVQVPFLQVALGGDLKIVPVLFGDVRYETAQAVADVLADIAQEKNILVIASTDLSHFHPYKEANGLDEQTIQEVVKLSPQGLQSFFETNDGAACGKCPVVTSLVYADRINADEIKVLKYANSGDTAGDKRKVVGYVSMAITKKGEEDMAEVNEGVVLSAESKNELFSIVRSTIRERLSAGKVTDIESSNPELQTENGVFVTLHTKRGALRGCIGCFQSDEPLYKTVQAMALSSAFRDPRFPPVQLDELNDLSVEISVLSPMKKIDDVNEIELGKHGIYIKKGFRSGTFLPQVATDTGWSLEEFLGHCARDKAGLGWDGWKKADVYTYTDTVFGEEGH